MGEQAAYQLDIARVGTSEQRYVITDAEDRLHVASSWLSSLIDRRYSPNTAKSYGAKVAAYLNWTTPFGDWRAATMAHLLLWRRVLLASDERKVRTVDIYLTALRSFYEWAHSRGMVPASLIAQLSEVKYYPPGTPVGGEHGSRKHVTSPRLRSVRPEWNAADTEWISDEAARDRLEMLPLPARDRLLIDLMYYTGIRIGEALALFTRDMHLAGGTPDSGCRLRDAHFHVGRENPVTNDVRAKGHERVLYAKDLLVDDYVDYLLDRHQILGESDTSPHVFVNLYNRGERLGGAMRYHRALDIVKACSEPIGFQLPGPHILRHTFATRLRRGIGVERQELDVIQALLGHRSIQSTRIYTHDTEAAMVAALMAIPSRRVDLS